MKIAVISDLHLGFRQYGSEEREQDFYSQFYKVGKEIRKCNPDMVIIAGDLFDKPNPSPKAINAYRKGIGNINADIVCTIKGNHTMLLRENHYSIDDFFGDDEFEGYYYLDDSSMTTSDFALSQGDMLFNKYKNISVQVDGITYRNNSSIDEFLEVQKKMAQNCSNDDTYKILVVHQSFKEFCGFVGEELSIEDIDYSSYNVVICGHIHSRFDIRLSDGTWFIQPGSIERMNTTEALDEQEKGKGFYLIDTEDDSITFYPVSCDRVFFLGDVEINSEEDIKNHIEKMSEVIEKLDTLPIISYNYQNNMKNIGQLREMVGRIDNNVLLNKSNIHDNTEEEIILEITDDEIPTILEALNTYGRESGLTKKEVQLVIDLYNALAEDSEDCSKLLDDYYQKNRTEHTEEVCIDKELEEAIKYFTE